MLYDGTRSGNKQQQPSGVVPVYLQRSAKVSTPLVLIFQAFAYLHISIQNFQKTKQNRKGQKHHFSARQIFFFFFTL